MFEPKPMQQVDRTYVLQRGRKLSYFAGCDYFRMTSHPEVIRAVHEGLDRYGLSVAASRLTTGNHPLFGRLEKRLASFFGAESALLLPTGYVTNLAVAQTLSGRFTHVLMDAKAHVSLQDAAPHFGCPVLTFQTRNPEDARRQLRTCGRRARPALLTDGPFASRGEMAPLRDYLELLPQDGLMLMDDAHGVGALGQHGRGAFELAGIDRSRVIQTLTLSKAFGVYGGVVLGPKWLRALMIERCHVAAGSTPMPLPMVAAALKAVEIVRRDTSLRRRLNRHTQQIKTTLRQAGWDIPDTPVPVLMVLPNSAAAAGRLRRALLARKIFPSFICYPGGPPEGAFRFVWSSEHTDVQVHALLDALLSGWDTAS